MRLSDNYLDIQPADLAEIHGEAVSWIDTEEVQPVNKAQLYAKEIKSCIVIGDKGRRHFVDGRFADLYKKYNDVIYANGCFYTPEGAKSAGSIRQEIHDSILELFPDNIASNTTKVLNALQDSAYKDHFDFTGSWVIPFNNGDMVIRKHQRWSFILGQKQPVPYRLPVDFIPITQKRQTPMFNKWLSDLFDPADVVTLQEFIGYCFLPTNKAQKALLLIGEGGVGKSVISSILRAIFGNAVTVPDSTTEFLREKFKLAELENQLIFYEDDLDDASLEDAGKFKKLITNQSAITAERKGKDPFKFIPFCRFIMCGNHMIEADSDKSDGFYRRLLPLQIKPKEKDRKDILGFEVLVAAEAEGIVQWALTGLRRLIDNDWYFTISDRTVKYMSQYKQLTDHLPLFMEDCIVRDPERDLSNAELKLAYHNWCEKNGVKPMRLKDFNSWLFNNLAEHGLEMTANASIYRNGGRTRGYRGGYIPEAWLTQGGLLKIV